MSKRTHLSVILLTTSVAATACTDSQEASPAPAPAVFEGGMTVDSNKAETGIVAAKGDVTANGIAGEERKVAKNAGLQAILEGAGGAGKVSEAFGPGGLGTGVNDAMGGLRGSSQGSARGAGGLGLRGTRGGESGAMSLGYGRSAGSIGKFGKRRDAPAYFEGHDAKINHVTHADEDRLSTFAIDVDTAAYSIARRRILSNVAPVPSLVRVEEFVNYFRYDYDPPTDAESLFSIQADGALSPVDETKHILRVGVQAKIIEPPARKPANLVFLVDTSCSMRSADKLELAKKSMTIAVAQLGVEDRVAITTYAGGVNTVLPPTRGHEKTRIRAAIESLTNGGGTAMASGMAVAYQQAAKMVTNGRTTRVIVMSDGDANIGATSHGQMLERIREQVKAGVTMSTIGFGQGNYKDATMEQLANDGNGNYYYIDSPRMAERVFGRDFTKMIQDVAQDVKIQVDFDPDVVEHYRLVGYENRAIADEDFRNDKVDAGEIGAGHQVTAIYELKLKPGAEAAIGTVRIRAKRPGGTKAKEVAFSVPRSVVDRAFASAEADFRFATAVMGAAEIFRASSHAKGWTLARVLSIASDTASSDADRREFVDLIRRAQRFDRTSVARR